MGIATGPGAGGAAAIWPFSPRAPHLQVLKILLHTCTQGSPQFVLQLKRNACFIREATGNGVRSGELGQESGEWPCVVLENSAWQPGRAQGGSCLQGLRALAGVGVLPHPASCLGAERPPALPPSCLAVFTGPPDPLHGNSLNQKVRAAAQVSAGPTPTVPNGPLKPCLEWQGSSASQSPASGPCWGAWCSPALCPHPPSLPAGLGQRSLFGCAAPPACRAACPSPASHG